VTDGWLGQLIALANAKGDFTAESAECAETKTEGGREGRPAVDLGAGSGDPRTARDPTPATAPARNNVSIAYCPLPIAYSTHDRPRRADVELRHAAATGRERALS
jgi:hypothetical protein